MNLREFLHYRENCPICSEKLVTSFHSKKQQVLRYEEDRFVVIFRMDSMNRKETNYKVGYSFGLDDHSWYAEFYDKETKRIEKDTPFFLRTRFRELDKNLGEYKFYRHCDKCHAYNYSSNDFYLDYVLATIHDLSVNVEYFGMSHPVEDGYKVFKLLNDYGGQKSTLLYGKSSNEDLVRADAGVLNRNSISTYKPPWNLDMIQVPIIRFTSKEETMERVKKLLVFS